MAVWQFWVIKVISSQGDICRRPGGKKLGRKRKKGGKMYISSIIGVKMALV